MRLTVLGKSPAWQDVDGACSGYLLQDGDTTVLIDCGNGVFGKLRKFVDYVDVDAVVISHLHADHFVDLVPYSYALIHAPRQQPVPVPPWPGPTPRTAAVDRPPDAKRTFRQVVGAWGNEDLIEQAFELEEYAVDSVVEVGTLRFGFALMPHFIDAYASRRPRRAAVGGSPTAPILGRLRNWSTSPAGPTCSSSRRRSRGPSGPGSAGT